MFEPSSESRSHFRKPADFTARLLLDNAVAECKTLDISLGGLCVVCDRHLTIQKKYAVAIETASGTRRINAWGKVIYCKPISSALFRTGIQFIDMDAYSEACITAFLDLPEHLTKLTAQADT